MLQLASCSLHPCLPRSDLGKVQPAGWYQHHVLSRWPCGQVATKESRMTTENLITGSSRASGGQIPFIKKMQTNIFIYTTTTNMSSFQFIIVFIKKTNIDVLQLQTYF